MDPSFAICFTDPVDNIPMPEELFVRESDGVLGIVDMRGQCPHAIEFYDFYLPFVEIFNALDLEVITSEMKSRDLTAYGIKDFFQLRRDKIRSIIEYRSSAMIADVIQLQYRSLWQDIIPLLLMSLLQELVIMFRSGMLEDEFLQSALAVSLDKHKSFFYDPCDMSCFLARHAIVGHTEFQWVIYEFLDQKIFFDLFHVMLEFFRIVDLLDSSACPSEIRFRDIWICDSALSEFLLCVVKRILDTDQYGFGF
jgi:hypothetical protein